MKPATIAHLLLAVCCRVRPAPAAEPAKLTFDSYAGYFVSNQFEPNAATSFIVIADQAQFDKVFGAAFVMRDKSHRLPKDAFKANLVLAAIHRGNAVWAYKVERVTESGGLVELRYTTTSTNSPTATFACPLIVSVPKGQYAAIRFVEDGKEVKKLAMTAPFVLSLDDATVGQRPQGWTAAKTGDGPSSLWKVVKDTDGKKVLAQISDEGPNRLFNLCIAENTAFTDMTFPSPSKPRQASSTKAAGRCGATRTPAITTSPA